MDHSALVSLLGSDEFWHSRKPAVFPPLHLAREGTLLLRKLEDSRWAPGAVVFASSGSSGAPKWILHTRESLLQSARMVNRFLRVTGKDKWFLALPGFHVGGFGVCVRAREAECGIATWPGKWDPAGFARGLERAEATLTSLVPTQVHDLVKGKHAAPATLRAVVVGGGRLDAQLGQAARSLGWPVLQSYGMTEAGSQVATAPLEHLELEFRNDGLALLPGWEARVDGQGALELRGDALFHGYLSLVEGELRCDDPRHGGWFPTRDLVEITSKGLVVKGRLDRQVKVRGELVDLDALEGTLQEFLGPGQDCCVVAVPDERVGNRLVPVVAPGSSEDKLPDLEKLNASLPKFSRMEKAEVLSQLPRTALGKVDFQLVKEALRVSTTSRLPKD